MGWRYFVITLGAVMLLFSFVRLLAFPMYESPRYLLGRGRDEDAVTVVRGIARYNGVEITLTVKDLEEVARGAEEKQGARKWRALSEGSPWTGNHVRQLFATKRMAWSTTLLISIWGMFWFSWQLELNQLWSGLIGLGTTLYNNFLPYLSVRMRVDRQTSIDISLQSSHPWS